MGDAGRDWGGAGDCVCQALGGVYMSESANLIKSSVRAVLAEIPDDVIVVAAAKTRSLEEVQAAVEAGIRHVGYNYVQEALPIIAALGNQVEWHMIGHLQTNKAKFVAESFDMCQTVDSWRLAKYLDHRCEMVRRKLPVLIEVNSGEESNKTGVRPNDVEPLVEKMTGLKHIFLQGLMTMGPRYGDPEKSRPYFVQTRAVFEQLQTRKMDGIELKYLSMGMSNSYQVAIEEGANIVRIGTRLFGQRL
jgi:PLP dependent protein